MTETTPEALVLEILTLAVRVSANNCAVSPPAFRGLLGDRLPLDVAVPARWQPRGQCTGFFAVSGQRFRKRSFGRSSRIPLAT